MLKIILTINLFFSPVALACELHGNNSGHSFFPMGQRGQNYRNMDRLYERNPIEEKLLDSPQRRARKIITKKKHEPKK